MKNIIDHINKSFDLCVNKQVLRTLKRVNNNFETVIESISSNSSDILAEFDNLEKNLSNGIKDTRINLSRDIKNLEPRTASYLVNYLVSSLT